MKLVLDTRFTFISGVLSLLLFIGAGALSATPVGLAGVGLIGFALGAFRRPSFFAYLGGIVSALIVCSGFSILLGDTLDAAIIMVPYILLLLLLFAGTSFFVGRLGGMLWHRITSHSTRTR
jgi:hypothetical protein